MRDLTFGVFEVTKDDGLSGAGLLASGFDMRVIERNGIFFCLESSCLDSLDTEGAFFHNSSASDSDIGVEDKFTKVIIAIVIEIGVIIIFKPIESADFIRAIICTVASSDTSVISLLV